MMLFLLFSVSFSIDASIHETSLCPHWNADNIRRRLTFSTQPCTQIDKFQQTPKMLGHVHNSRAYARWSYQQFY